MILYQSTNRNLVLPERKAFREKVSFREALLTGQAPDEGLFVPDRIPVLSYSDILALKNKPYTDAALLVTYAYLCDEIDRSVLEKIIIDSYPFGIPMELVSEKLYIMRLDQGPTASFKDFAARMMARLMSWFKGGEKRLNVLVATSGDTGSAVGEAFRGVEGINVCILYPGNEVSGRQKKQLDTIGDNVIAISVNGKFDDCQNLVKEAFADPELAHLNFTSANSINFGRILPQMIYYVYAYAQLADEGEDIVFCVPSGNFGNALGCEYARRMGLPVRKLVMPTNENDEFPDFLARSRYKKISPSRACLSNAMNVGHPSNLARFFELYGGTVDRKGIVYRMPDIGEMRRRIFSVSISDEVTRKCIKTAYEKYGILLEPHGAVGWRGLELFREKEGDSGLAVCLETAHPAKFPDEIIELLGMVPVMPESMKGIDERRGVPVEMDASYKDFKKYLEENLE
ncbi:MAG: threonine synthase [Syntrophales bacterium]|jgi:threonine synthase|nr:threonine synthase [Syntrophales bacterium]MDY0044073.1 threonine synthase [Syntrophales bacterium]